MILAVALIIKDDSTFIRIVNTDNNKVQDIDTTDKEKLKGVRNIRITGDNIECTEGDISKYPTIINGEVKNNIPLYLTSIMKKIMIANYTGKIVGVEESQLRSQIKQFANAKWLDNGLIEVYKETSKIEVKSRPNKPSKLGAFKALMSKQGKAVDIHGFNARDFCKQLGVSDDVSKDPYSIFVLGKPSSLTNITSDSSAYKLDIVKVDNRIELRKFHGRDYNGEVVIPPEVTHICEGVFSKTKVRKVSMSDTVVYVGDRAFFGSDIEEVKLSQRVTAIPFECFARSNLKLINLEHITSIDNEAFADCKIQNVIIKAPLAQIGYSAFEDCQNLEQFEHAGTVRKIRHDAFKNCILLSNFDFSSVTTLEQYAFYNTGITSATLNGEINYLQSGTITGKIEQVELLEGFTKISAGAVSNIDNQPIVWTMPKSAQNIEKHVFTSQDTVMCFRGSVSATQALLDEAQIVYLDELDSKSIPSIIKKANMINASVEDILRDTLSKILSKGDYDTEYDISEISVVNQDIPPVILDLIGGDFKYGSYASDDEIKNEKIKFKAILQHLSKVGQLDITPFSSVALDLKSTFRVVRKNNNSTQVLYDDGVSSVHRIRYADNKFTSVDSEFIVAKTKDTLRYICMDNRYTDIMCENPEIYDLTKLINVLRPGDTIGLNCVISGVKYPEIASDSDKKIQVTKNNIKREVKLKMNIYQALRYSSITLKLDANTIVLIIPGNGKMIKCASLGKSVWQNEKEETYKSLQCTIVSIEDIDTNTIFDYESTYKSSNYGQLLKKLRAIYTSNKQEYIDSYSHIFAAEQSMYKVVGDYAQENHMDSIETLDTAFMEKLFNTSLFEERQESWLEGSIGKTIVADAEFEFNLIDGAKLRQYRTVKKTALRNKLMSGGDRKLYIFELIDNYGLRCGVYISLYDIRTLTDMCLNINEVINRKDRDVLEADDGRIFVNKDKFDIVGYNNIIEIAPLCRESKLHISSVSAVFVFAVYKPNGLYYIGLKIEYGKSFRFIPILQIGELDVALGFIEESNKYGNGSEAMKYLFLGATEIIYNEYMKRLGQTYYRRSNPKEYLGILKARELCIDGVSGISEYNKTGLPEVLKRCLGYTSNIIKRSTLNISTNDIDYMPDADLDGLIDDQDDEESVEVLDTEELTDSDLEALNIANKLAEQDFDISDSDFDDF